MRAMKDSGVEWIGEIPEGWETVKLKNAVSLRLEKTTEKGIGLPYIGLEQVESFNGTLKSSLDVTDFDGDTLNYYDGDVLFGKLRPYLAKAYLANKAGRCSSEFWVLRSAKIDSKFLLYTVLSNYFIDNINHSTFGVKMPRAEWTYAGDQIMCCPDDRSQSRIAAYLDAKCADIDALIAGKEKTNTLLKEYRQSIIYEAVTKGLDPDAPMKDSGVEWIGEIPTEWSMVKLGLLFDLVGSGTTPTSSNGAYYDGDHSWLQTGDLNDGYVYSTTKTITDSAIENCSALALYEKGTVVMAMYGATIGKLGILGIDCYMNQACCAFSNPRGVNVKYVFYWLLCNRDNIVNLSLGGGQPNISQNIASSLRISLPLVIGGQDTIVTYLDAKCAEIDELIVANSTTIQKLKEYRQSLIYEAVTGKKEI